MPSGDFWGTASKLIGTLFALCLVLFLAWLLIRWLNRRMPGVSGGSGRSIQVIDRVQVAKGSTIVMLRVEEKVFLVAVSEHAVEKLSEFDDPEGKYAPQKVAQSPSFGNALKDAVGKLGLGKKNGEDDAP